MSKKHSNDVWKGAGAQFATSVLSVIQGNNSLKRATNESILAAAMKAAVLNLPIEQVWEVPISFHTKVKHSSSLGTKV
mgnify:CR=1 FL=1